MRIYFETYDFLQNFAKTEIENLLEIEVLKYKDNFLEFEGEIDFLKILYYSRTLKRVYIEFNEEVFEKFSKKNLLFNFISDYDEKVILDVEKKFPGLKFDNKTAKLSFSIFDGKLLLDVFDFNLFEREFLLNKSKNIPPSPVLVYALNVFNVDFEKGVSLIDIGSNYGEFILETSYFGVKKVLNFKKKGFIPLNYFYKLKNELPQSLDSQSKFRSIVFSNIDFKKIKENISFTGLKIRVSQFDLSWLDVKFKRNEFDYLISSSLENNDKFCNEFFYMSEFICKKKMLLVLDFALEEKYFLKYKLRLLRKKSVNFENKNYFIYVLK